VNELALPADYAAVLSELKDRVRSARARTIRQVNTELISLYWTIGQTILNQQEAAGWGSGVVNRLAADLRDAFPDMTVLSRRNLLYMRAFLPRTDGSHPKLVLHTCGRRADQRPLFWGRELREFSGKHTSFTG
jgi:hypothetical protein